MVLNGTVLNVATTPEMRKMPLSLSNDLPAAVFRFGTTSEDEVPFACHLDTFAAMNTGNLHLHQWIITNYPHIVDSYEQYDDANPVNTMTLDCAVSASEVGKQLAS